MDRLGSCTPAQERYCTGIRELAFLSDCRRADELARAKRIGQQRGRIALRCPMQSLRAEIIAETQTRSLSLQTRASTNTPSEKDHVDQYAIGVSVKEMGAAHINH
jgi:hypothetical protein